jgi:hypothetical protein
LEEQQREAAARSNLAAKKQQQQQQHHHHHHHQGKPQPIAGIAPGAPGMSAATRSGLQSSDLHHARRSGEF